MYLGDHMVYLLYGIKDFSIDEKIKKLVSGFLDVNRFDLNIHSINDVIDDLETFSLFGDKKAVVVENANAFLAGFSTSLELEKYLENVNPYTILILVCRSEKIDSRKKITKLVQKNGKIIEFNDDIDIKKYTKELFDNYNISSADLDFFINRVGSNPLILHSEVQKLILYKDDDLNITKDDILNVSVKSNNFDVFKLIDYILTGRKDLAIEMYNNMLLINEEPLKVLIMLANQFRIIYQSKELLFKGYSERDIAGVLKIHPYRVKLALQTSRGYSSEILLKYLYDLSEIDYGIKTGFLDKNLALELFILK